MRLLFAALLIFLLSNCGFNGDQKLTTNDSKQNIVTSGTAYYYVLVGAEFIQQIHDLCVDYIVPGDYQTYQEYRKAVADCTFQHLTSLNLNIVADFNSKYCDPKVDVSGLTPQQLADITNMCNILSGGLK